VCCTYAIKEAGLDAAVFYIDMRTFGKDFEQYYNRAKEESGVRFVKSKITNIDSNQDTGMQVIRYVDEAGRRLEEEFDMVVLSVGLSASIKTAEQAKKWGIDLDHYNYAKTNSFDPVQTSRPGIYVCGIFQGPKDIPSSVIDSSAAAGVAGSSLADVRWTLTKTREIPEEKDVRGEPPRIGVFVCRCGTIFKESTRCCLCGREHVQLLPGHPGQHDRDHQGAWVEPCGGGGMYAQDPRAVVSGDADQRRDQQIPVRDGKHPEPVFLGTQRRPGPGHGKIERYGKNGGG
jgi:hypothetical protein